MFLTAKNSKYVLSENIRRYHSAIVNLLGPISVTKAGLHSLIDAENPSTEQIHVSTETCCWVLLSLLAISAKAVPSSDENRVHKHSNEKKSMVAERSHRKTDQILDVILKKNCFSL